MARPAARVLTLLELLQSGGTRTVTELADRLGVDGRTVRRYVDHLIDLDVPVESVRGLYGGYRGSPPGTACPRSCSATTKHWPCCSAWPPPGGPG